MKKTLIIGLMLLLILVTAGIISAADSGSTQYLINNSTVYKVDATSLWTTSLNNLTVITQHRVTSATQIYLNDRPAQLFDLKPGFKVTVVYINDQFKTAVTIKAYSTITP
jgi:hypothetical protein